jgi:hypothetical protein
MNQKPQFAKSRPSWRMSGVQAVCAALAAIAGSGVAAADPTASNAVSTAQHARDVVRTARLDLETARLRAMQRFDRSPAGRALAEQVAACEGQLATSIADNPEGDHIAAASALQNARASLDAARQAAVEADMGVRHAVKATTNPELR